MTGLVPFPAIPATAVADPRVDLHRQLDELHQMIYRRGGIRPVNAAIEELTKLLLLELKLSEDPDHEVPGRGRLREILDPARVELSDDVAPVKDAFRHVAALPVYGGRLPGGGFQPIWPPDEPLRISRADVVAAAIRVLRGQLQPFDPKRFDVIGDAFDIFLRGRYDHSGGLGTHLTPHTVATHLARICLSGLDIAPRSVRGPVIGDPCCGTGRFLIAAINELGLDPEDPQRLELLEHGLLGADQSASAVAKARINLLLLGARRPNVFVVADSIVDRHLDASRGQLRLILTNPPFGDGKYDSDEGIQRSGEIVRGLAGKRRVDPALAFVARCLDLLADGGRLGIILPDGLVDGPVLRTALLGTDGLRLRDVSVEANVSLPTVTFALAGTVARTSALILRKQAASHGRIFLARADHVGYLKQGSTSVPDPAGDDLPAIADAASSVLRRPVADTTTEVMFVSHKPLAAVVPARDATTLDPSRVDPAAFSARHTLRQSGLSFRDLLRPAKRRQQKGHGSRPFISVLHIDDLGAVAWHEADTYQPTTPGLEALPGDVLFSLLNPRKLRATVVPEEVGPVLCSSEFGVFVPTGDSYEALVLLHHPLVRAQLAPLGRGTSSSRRRISPEDLLAISVPRLSDGSLSLLADDLREALRKLREASQAVARCYSEAAVAPDQALRGEQSRRSSKG